MTNKYPVEPWEAEMIAEDEAKFRRVSNICVALMAAVIVITFLHMMTFFNTAKAEEKGPGQAFYTVIGGQIYETPIPDDCPGCQIVDCEVFTDDIWVRLKTDLISRDGFE